MKGTFYSAALAATGTFFLASATSAAPVMQGGGQNHIALEAENFVSSTVVDPNEPILTIVDDSAVGASGGLALVAADPDPGEVYTGPTPNYVTYQVQFNQAGTYNVYLRGRGVNDGTGGNAGSDSVFVSEDWDDNTPQTVVDLPDAGPAGYLYRDGGALTVDIADLGTLLSFSIGTREDEALVDRLVFTTDTYDIGYSDVDGPAAGHAELHALPNSAPVPEPGTFALAGLAGLGLMKRKTR